jgi:hypothetical protein
MDADFVYDGDIAAADRAAVWQILDPAHFRNLDDWSSVTRRLHDLLERVRIETVDALGGLR